MTNALLPDRLIAALQSHPDKPAIICGNSVTTYSELGHAVFRLANALQKIVPKHERVAAVLDNSDKYVATCYATWIAGGIFVGINTALKEPESLRLIEQCDASLCVVDAKFRALRDRLAAKNLRVIVTAPTGDEVLHNNEVLWGDLLEQADDVRPRTTLDAHSGAMIIFTSGTTGSPKGVLLSHRNLAANTQSIQHYLGIRADDTAMCVLPFFYSYGNSVLHTHLTAGSTLVLENSFMYPQQVIASMATHAVTAFYGVPSTYYLLLDRTQLTKDAIPALRYCAQAGGAMDPARIEDFCERMSDTQFFVMFGQTEASARLTYLPPSERVRKQGSVGIPVPGVTLSIRDASGLEIDNGQQGEVCARGNNIMSGYWMDPEETAKVLRDGWLCTGDLGYRDKEGYLYLIGRSREMIKSGAHRIAPKEIEDIIASVPGVKEVAVIGVPDPILGESIKACVVASSAQADLSKLIQRTCREQLALYKVPKSVEFFKDLPRTASGKVMKHMLLSM